MVALAGLVWLAGCAVGPNYQHPAINSPAKFRGDDTPTNAAVAEFLWWQVYQDASLQALIREAFTNNYDLRIAAARVEQSRAVSHAGLIPIRTQRQLRRQCWAGPEL